MSAKEVKWLLDELPGLVDAGVIPPDCAERVRRHYAALPVKGRLPLATILLATLGALCVGLGIILVLASNWEQLSRPARTVVAFIPMIAAQLLAGYTILRRPRSTALREGTGAFLVLAVAACIALVGQTYNVPGNLAGFLFTWLWLTLPIGYLLRAVLPSALYIAIVVGWAIELQFEDNRAVLFWPLMALVVPHLVLEWRRDRSSTPTVFLAWVFCAGLAIGTGVSMVRTLPGLWTIVYTGLFATVYLLGLKWQEGWQSVWRRPFHAFGAAATGILALLLSFTWPWREIGWHHYRDLSAYYEYAAIGDYVLAIVFPVAAAALTILLVVQGRPGAALYGVSPLVAAAGYVLATENAPELAGYLFCAYLLALGAGTLAAGLRLGKLTVVNGGMFLLAGLIVARFFDSDVSFAVRGVAFIVLGLVFLGTNIVLWRQGVGRTGETA